MNVFLLIAIASYASEVLPFEINTNNTAKSENTQQIINNQLNLNKSHKKSAAQYKLLSKQFDILYDTKHITFDEQHAYIHIDKRILKQDQNNLQTTIIELIKEICKFYNIYLEIEKYTELNQCSATIEHIIKDFILNLMIYLQIPNSCLKTLYYLFLLAIFDKSKTAELYNVLIPFHSEYEIFKHLKSKNKDIMNFIFTNKDAYLLNIDEQGKIYIINHKGEVYDKRQTFYSTAVTINYLRMIHMYSVLFPKYIPYATQASNTIELNKIIMLLTLSYIKKHHIQNEQEKLKIYNNFMISIFNKN